MKREKKRRTILVVGQTPPPYHGQAVMIDRLLRCNMKGVERVHVPLDFSDDLNTVGRFKWKKIGRLFRVVFRIWRARFRFGAEVMYYPPASPALVPVLRDLVVLSATRFLFESVIFHFHAAGLAEFRTQLGIPWVWLFDMAYGKPDAAVQMSLTGPNDAAAIGAVRTIVIPYGIEDRIAGLEKRKRQATPRILFVGLLVESKGVSTLLDACGILRTEGFDFRLDVVGKARSASYGESLSERIREMNLQDQVVLHGERRGDAKWRAYGEADIFCFPSHYEAEAFPVVLLEAMSFGLPIVTTRWRGIPEIVADGEAGVLVPPKDPQALAVALGRILEDPALAAELGSRARRRYEQEYKESKYVASFEALFRWALDEWAETPSSLVRTVGGDADAAWERIDP